MTHAPTLSYTALVPSGAARLAPPAAPVGVGCGGGCGGGAPGGAPFGVVRSSSPRVYTIQPGDTTTSIAELFGIRPAEMVALNPVKSRAWYPGIGTVFASLVIGEKVFVPGVVTGVVIGGRRVGVGDAAGNALCADGSQPYDDGTCLDGSTPSVAQNPPVQCNGAGNINDPNNGAACICDNSNGWYANPNGCGYLSSTTAVCCSQAGQGDLTGAKVAPTGGGSGGSGGGTTDPYAAAKATCAAQGNTWDPNLNYCVIPAPVPSCPAGQTLQTDGTCVASAVSCPSGQALQANGTCGTYLPVCTSSQVRLASGGCGTPAPLPAPAAAKSNTALYAGLGVAALLGIGVVIAAESHTKKTKKSGAHPAHAAHVVHHHATEGHRER